MAFSPSAPLLYPPPTQPPLPSSSPSATSYPFILQFPQNQTTHFRSRRTKASIAHRELQSLAEEEDPQSHHANTNNKNKKKQKLRPSFHDQTMQRWSVRISSNRTNLPWQQREDPQTLAVAVQPHLATGGSPSPASRTIPAPWAHGGGATKMTQFHNSSEIARIAAEKGESSDKGAGKGGGDVHCGVVELGRVGVREEEGRTKVWKNPMKLTIGNLHTEDSSSKHSTVIVSDDHSFDLSKNDVESSKLESGWIQSTTIYAAKSSVHCLSKSLNGRDVDAKVAPPWQRGNGDDEEERKWEMSNTELAERTIPEPELRRLRNAALRMKERTKVGSAGVTEALVEHIKEKWKESEVVKLRFEGQPAINMRRTHDLLESKSGGVIIWRSGSSVVLYRGMSYKLSCVHSYPEKNFSKSNPMKSSKNTVAQDEANFHKHLMRTTSTTAGSSKVQSNESIITSDIDSLLDELGPRFRDWAGREPLPVDADLLPLVIPGYRPPFRFLPHRAKLALLNSEMTYLRRLARSMPPHFALGRNRENHGLAQAMVKLWEKSLIAKIAIKRGVPNTCNDRMAEEIRKLTGGVLLSRNKEYIVFYRGNDFLTPPIAKILLEREKLANVRQDEEDQARQRASDLLVSSSKVHRGPRLAGTLAESVEAKMHWTNEPNKREREKMMEEEILSKHESLVRYMEKKLALAQEKVRRAERALAKVQESLKPTDLPNDLEIVTDEERFLFRKMGLKMRSFLTLGRRGVFDGTIENMHLNWKYRELVKILVKDKSFALVKHIAIDLEAESGGVLISLDKTTKGYAIILYRGKNYLRPQLLRPRNLLTRRQALARSIELQRREALKHHISNLQEKMQTVKDELEQMRIKQISGVDEPTEIRSVISSNDVDLEEEGEEAYLETFEWDSDRPI